MQIYQQKNNNDCMLAAIATLLQRPYDELFDSSWTERAVKEKGANEQFTTEALAHVGLKDRVDYRHIYLHRHGADEELKRLFWGRRAIFSVQTLNHEFGSHAVAWIGNTLLDPSNKVAYKYIGSVMINTAWIFNELDRKKD